MRRLLIGHAAPTLANLKTANMFNYSLKSNELLAEELLVLNQELNPKGIYLEVLRQSLKSVLVYVYRPKRLIEDLKNEKTALLLKTIGYENPLEIRKSLDDLKKRLRFSSEFPHEVGVFLGYPIEDVIGFISNGGENYKCSGYWKVYEDEEKSIRLFHEFNQCREIYDTLFLKGYSIDEITVL